MAKLNMDGPFPFHEDEVDSRIRKGRIGNYAFAYYKVQHDRYYVRYIGRSDKDLNGRIKHGLEEMQENLSLCYDFFFFSYADTPEQAYEKECQNYHEFGGDRGMLVNKIHPDKPEGCDVECPVCKNL